MEPTKWEAEQAIRPVVVNRKVGGGNRTWAGARSQEVLTSVLETCRRAGHSALDFVSQSLRPFGTPPSAARRPFTTLDKHFFATDNDLALPT